MNQNQSRSAPITVTDVNIPFGRLVVIILKFMLASIPALIVFYAIFAFVALCLALLFGGLFSPHNLHFAP
jgi:hypothetical protein